MSFAMFSSSVVTVNATVEGILLRRSLSLTTTLPFVMIWILHLFWARISRHRLVKQVYVSASGYGSDELDIEIVSPTSFTASRFKIASRFFFGLHSLKFGT